MHDMKHVMQVLQKAARANGPLCIGLDTDPAYLPPSVLGGGTGAAAVLAYNTAIIERVAAQKSACCFKVQIAYYEAMGMEGMAAYRDTLRAVKQHGFTVISDIKRGDIAATAEAYARAHFTGDFESDILTINPYMGFDTIQPFAGYCAPQNGAKGLFVLLRTSNPGMTDIEQQELRSGGRVLDRVGAELERLCTVYDGLYDGETCPPIGAVVGCTEESDARLLRDAYPRLFFLIPGYGAQGGAARIAATLLDKAGGTVNSSRGILCAWKKDPALEKQRQDGTLTLDDIADAAARAAQAAKADLLAAKKELGL